MTVHSHLTIVLLILAVDVLFCLAVAAAAGMLARMDGASQAAVLTRCGIAFASAFTMSLALLTFLAAVLG
ncbi:hypothetical protein OG594_46605 [Streptomyces sp. NBC_01214]|uniref:hypothetical protein n=1 Tax=Streptomyces sp. NBC_01214 TaxID=2903777 RepID=UPI0022512723|nr:hypothetical protein [Streptomyces sp. NBC_01214]MCX4808928.1 hypothetical protein [Streptomyces sp. NBC_01214]